MQRQMLKSKIHRATVTDCDVDYVGSITIDPELMAQADMLPNEQVHVWDIDNGARFVTYAIEGEPGSGTMQVNGAAAHLTRPGDKVIVASFGAYDESDLERYSPVVVHVDDDNRSVAVDSHPEVLLAGRSRRPTSASSWQPAPAGRARRQHRPSAAGDAAAPGRDEGGGRADRDGHRLRLPLGAGRRGGRRRHRPRRRHRRDGRARLRRDRAGRRWTRWSCSAAAVRRGLTTPLLVGDMPFGSLRGLERARRSRTPSASSRRPAATRSSSSAAAPRSTGPGRSSAPASR